MLRSGRADELRQFTTARRRQLANVLLDPAAALG
jgi:hypothetical protein